jgi:hypothetical protein
VIGGRWAEPEMAELEWEAGDMAVDAVKNVRIGVGGRRHDRDGTITDRSRGRQMSQGDPFPFQP